MTLFLEISIALVLAAFCGTVFYFFKQPTVVGFIVAGLIIGYFGYLNDQANLDLVESLSSIGVALLLFIVVKLLPDKIVLIADFLDLFQYFRAAAVRCFRFPIAVQRANAVTGRFEIQPLFGMLSRFLELPARVFPQFADLAQQAFLFLAPFFPL